MFAPQGHVAINGHIQCQIEDRSRTVSPSFFGLLAGGWFYDVSLALLPLLRPNSRP